MNLVRLDLFAWIFPSPSSSGCPISVYYSRADSEALLLLGLFIFGDYSESVRSTSFFDNASFTVFRSSTRIYVVLIYILGENRTCPRTTNF